MKFYLKHSGDEIDKESIVPGGMIFHRAKRPRRNFTFLDNYIGVLGILFADYRQTVVKQYIISDLEIINSKAAEYIDFILPGYSYERYGTKEEREVKGVTLNGQKVYFDEESFSEYMLQYRERFSMEYEEKPILVLHEVTENGFLSPYRIILQLESTEIKELFDKIILLAKEEIHLDAFSSKLGKRTLFSRLPKLLLILANTLTGIDIKETKDALSNDKRFKIR